MARCARQALMAPRFFGHAKVTKQAYLYMDMLRILTMTCDHKEADLALIMNGHTQVNTYLDIMMAED